LYKVDQVVLGTAEERSLKERLLGFSIYLSVDTHQIHVVTDVEGGHQSVDVAPNLEGYVEESRL
jgi:hypothetical protein